MSTEPIAVSPIAVRGDLLCPGDVLLGSPGRVITERLGSTRGRFTTTFSYRTRGGAIVRLLPAADYLILRPVPEDVQG